MPEHSGPDMQADRDLAKYDYIKFMERLIDEPGSNGHPSMNGRSSRLSISSRLSSGSNR